MKKRVKKAAANEKVERMQYYMYKLQWIENSSAWMGTSPDGSWFLGKRASHT